MKRDRAALRIIAPAAALLALTALRPVPAAGETAPLRATQPSAQAAPAPQTPAPAGPVARGKVLETMNVSSYTYARVETASGEVWLAGPQTRLQVGDVVGWRGGTVMKGFHSKTLDRTFDSILFVDRLVTADAAAADPGAASVVSPHGAPASSAQGSSPHGAGGTPAGATPASPRTP